MELLAARGNLAEALRVYDQLRVLLRDELGATPAPHVTALHDRLLMQDEAPPPAPRRPRAGLPLPAVLAGARSGPSSAGLRSSPPLRRAWELGQGAVVVVVGEAGMGKTRLAAPFRRRGARGRRRGAARADRRGDRRPVPAVRRSAPPLRGPRAAGDGRGPRGARPAGPGAGRRRRGVRRAGEPPLPAVRGRRRAARPRRRRAAAAARRRGPPVGGHADAAAAPPRRPPPRGRRCSCW